MIGIFGGVAVLILVFAMLGCLRIIKCPLACQTFVFWKKESEDDENVEEFIRNYGSLAPKRYNYSDVKKMTNSFTSKLGEGGFGCVTKESSLMVAWSRRALIYEFMPNGSLDKFIYNRGSSNESLNLEWKTMYQIAVGIARGLEYLYRESMVSMTHARGTTGYIAPEVFCRNFGGVSHKSDVYSYGMLVLEMVGGRKNIDVQVSHSSQIHFPTWIYKQLQPGKDLTVLRSITNEEEEETARKMVLVSLWCIQPNPSDRPSIDKVVEMLEGSSHLLEIPPNPFMFSTQNTPQSTVVHIFVTTLQDLHLKSSVAENPKEDTMLQRKGGTPSHVSELDRDYQDMALWTCTDRLVNACITSLSEEALKSNFGLATYYAVLKAFSNTYNLDSEAYYT
ncbi:Leaf rust 10 disease resistance locus receptor-like protein kinase-like 2.8 [Vitis vinifera]|uniref:Leaf rust 10 disease resistance locus receptor-like protein kinase-like 2.8 n=1 Tax=Vitis vinifera TaxID=29760 RepID=A0A438G983_VITVI|nr:Leaf rust 10 disease resistance locus receptor-like protein kinase-like 2.8 [Vitis vinifera]